MYPIRLLEGSPYDETKLQSEIADLGVQSLLARYDDTMQDKHHDPWPRMMHAYLQFYAQDLTAALSELESLCGIEELGATPHLLTAAVLSLNGQLAESLEQLDEGLALAPSDQRLLMTKAQLLLSANHKASARDLISLVPENGRDPGLWVSLADLSIMEGKMSDAEDALEAALARSESLGWDSVTRPVEFTALYARMTHVQLQRGDADAAMEAAEKAYEIFPDDIELNLIKAQALSAADRAEEGLGLIDQLLNREPELRPALLMRQVLLSQLGREQEAIATAERINQLDSHGNKGVALQIDSKVTAPFGAPDLLNARINYSQGSMKGRSLGGLLGLPVYDPDEKTVLHVIGPNQSATRVLFSLPIIGFLRNIKDAFSNNPSQTPRLHRIFDAILSLYPVAAGIAAYLGLEAAALATVALPFIVIFIMVVCAAIAPARVLVLPARRALGAAVLGVVAGAFGSWLAGDSLGLTWPVTIGIVLVWIFGASLATIPRLQRNNLLPGELMFGSRGLTTELPPSQDVTGVRVEQFGGDVEVDLRNIRIAQKPVVIELSAFFSTVRFRIRPQWTVASWREQFAGWGIGEFKDPVFPPPEGVPPHLLIKGVIINCNIEFQY